MKSRQLLLVGLLLVVIFLRNSFETDGDETDSLWIEDYDEDIFAKIRQMKETVKKKLGAKISTTVKPSTTTQYADQILAVMKKRLGAIASTTTVKPPKKIGNPYQHLIRPQPQPKSTLGKIKAFFG